MLEVDYIINRKKSIEPLVNENFNVYFLIKNDEIVYVGKTVNFISRFKSHLKDKDFDSYYIHFYETQEQADEMELNYILKLKPFYNKMLPKNERYFSIKTLKKYFEVNLWTLKRHIKNNRINEVGVFMGIPHYDINDFYDMEV